MLAKIIETAYWIGIAVVGIGVIGLIITLTREKIAGWIPLKNVNIKYTKTEKSQIVKQNSISPAVLDIANKKVDKLTEELKPFWALRNGQLQNLKQTNSTLIISKLESIQFHGLKYQEPIVIIQVNFINCSMFKLKLEDIKLTVDLNQNSLSLPSSLMTESTQVYYGAILPLQFKQPVTSITADSLKNLLDKHNDKITWKLQLKASCIIEETKERCPLFTHTLDHTGIPF